MRKVLSMTWMKPLAEASYKHYNSFYAYCHIFYLCIITNRLRNFKSQWWVKPSLKILASISNHSASLAWTEFPTKLTNLRKILRKINYVRTIKHTLFYYQSTLPLRVSKYGGRGGRVISTYVYWQYPRRFLQVAHY